jgi:hypothetical protein
MGEVVTTERRSHREKPSPVKGDSSKTTASGLSSATLRTASDVAVGSTTNPSVLNEANTGVEPTPRIHDMDGCRAIFPLEVIGSPNYLVNPAKFRVSI